MKRFGWRILLIVLISFFLLSASNSLAEASESNQSRIYQIERTCEITNNSSSDADNLVVTFYIMDNHSVWASQQILDENIYADGSPIDSPPAGENYRKLKVNLGTLSGGTSKTITVEQRLRADAIDKEIGPENVSGEIPSEYAEYTDPVENLWQSDHSSIQGKASELTENVSDYYLKAENIFNFVQEHLEYETQSEAHSALWAYDNQVGDCTEYANLFIALCRAAGIPAMFLSGYLYKIDTNSMGRHAFTRIYLPNVGWVVVDATEAASGGGGIFCGITNSHIVKMICHGSEMVKDNDIKPPALKYQYKSSQTLDIDVTLTSNADLRMGLDVDVILDPEMVENVAKITAKVANKGIYDLSNVTVDLQVDNKYFLKPPSESLDNLNSGYYENAYFDLEVKTNVENSPVTAVVTYDSPYGTFTGEGTALITITIGLPNSPTLKSLSDGASTLDNTPTFEWDGVPGAEYYRLLIDDSSDFGDGDNIYDRKGISSAWITIENELPTDNYYWKVCAINEYGENWSTVFSLEIKKDETPPNAPTGLSDNPVSSSEIDLSWDDNPEDDLDCYNVYRSTSSGFTLSGDNFVSESDISGYEDMGLENNTTYYYKVTAVDDVGNESDSSSEVSATTGSGLGDVNGDTDIDIVDALQVARHDVGLDSSPFYEGDADVNDDSNVDIVDALQIARYSAGLIENFG